MYRQMLRRLLSILVLITVASALAVVPQVARTPSAFANVTTGGSACGVLTAYLPATPFAAGQIVIGNTAYSIAPGTTLSGNPSFLLGSSVCLSATVNGSGQIVGGTLSTNFTSNVSVCGVVTAFTSPTSVTAGSVTINGQSYVIAPNNSLGLMVVTLGASYCLNSFLNGFGQLTGGTLTLGSANAVNVCGVVTAYTSPSIFAPGFITIGGQTYVIAPGVALTSTGLVGAGVVCLTVFLNGAGQISSGSFSGVPSSTNTVSVCGAFGGFTAATASTPGSIVISGQTIPIGVGVVLGGSILLAANTTICLNGTTNAAGQIILGAVFPTVLAPLTICGTLTAYTLSTASTAGSITIGGHTYGIAAGVTLSGAGLLTISANPTLCLQASLNGAGQISTGSLGLTLGGTPSVNVCGMVTAYTAATATADGTITVASNTLAITAGAVFVGVAQPAVGAGVCLALVVNSSGAIVGGTVVNTSTGIPLSAAIVTHSGHPHLQMIAE
jgi:filamentous hemagglutinin